MDFDILKWHCEDSSLYQTIALPLQNEGPNQPRFTPLVATAYLSHLPNPTPSHHLSSMRLPKYIKNERCFIFLQKIGRRKTKGILRVLK